MRILRSLILLATSAAVVWLAHPRVSRLIERARLTTPAAEVSPAAGGEDHFSPTENLERLDVERLKTAQHTIDVAMYSFTDRFLAEELLRRARAGVSIRIYRDGEQFEQEARYSTRYRNGSVTAMLRGEPSIHIRVKQASRRELMHLKALCIDGRLLRDGSANWSPAGEKAQDNNARYTTDPEQVRAFQWVFEAMWARPGNRIIQ